MKFKLIIILILSYLAACTQVNQDNKIGFTIIKQDLKLNFDIPGKQIQVVDLLEFKGKLPLNSISFLINQSVRIEKISVGNQELKYQLDKQFPTEKFRQSTETSDDSEFENASELKIFFKKKMSEGLLHLKYSLSAKDLVEKAAFSREYIAYQIKGYIGDKGIFISPDYYWYPSLPENLSNFRINITCPDTLQILTQGQLTQNTVTQGKRHIEWQMNYPAEAVHLVGANYSVQQTKYKDVNIYTYFFQNTQAETPELSASYLSACKRYLAMYEALIGPYPFSKFAVVENFFPTGYGMPSFTLLGSQIIRLPFIIYTSLGHEITHNWWGNSVYVDYESGNWCEGLTTYFADYHYKEMQGPEAAKEYRRDIDRDFTVYVKGDKDIPLSQFKARTESASRAVGYGKSAMVFHQLRKMIGDSLFWESFRDFYKTNKFRRASWDDIQSSVEKVSGQKLDWYFEQWIQRKGAPEIRLISKRFKDSMLHIQLGQEEPTYGLRIPVKIETLHGDFLRTVELNEQQQGYMFMLEWVPRKLFIDPDFDVFRRLDQKEVPPTLAEIFAQDSVILLLPDQCGEKKSEIYRQFANNFAEGESKYLIKKNESLSGEETNNRSLIILGSLQENSFFQTVDLEKHTEVQFKDQQIYLNGKKTPLSDELSVVTFRNRENPGQNVCLISIGDEGKIGRVATLLKHYGKYSYLVFKNGKNSAKGVFAVTDSPLAADM